MTLGLTVDPADASASVRLVEVALDAAGAGGSRTYTYRVPPALADLVPGEAVLVEFGRRQALGIILAETEARPSPNRRPSWTGSARTAHCCRRSAWPWPDPSPITISRRRRWSCARCCRRGCSNGWNSSPN